MTAMTIALLAGIYAVLVQIAGQQNPGPARDYIAEKEIDDYVVAAHCWQPPRRRWSKRLGSWLVWLSIVTFIGMWITH